MKTLLALRPHLAHRWAWPSAVVIVITATAIAVYRFPGAGHDDTYFMLWAGETFYLSSWFVNYNYEPQEIASSILAAAIARAASYLAPTWTFTAYKSIGLAAYLGTMLAIWKCRHELFQTNRANAGGLFVLAASSLSPFVQYWTLGGLETPYHMLLFVLFPIALSRYARYGTAATAWILAAILVMLILVRAEGFTAVAVAVLVLLVTSKPRRLPLTAWHPVAILIPLGFLAALFLVRLHFTGGIFPNPVYAKVGLSFAAISQGFAYFKDYHLQSILSLAHFFVSCFCVGYVVVNVLNRGANLHSAADHTLFAMSAVLASYDAFIILVGGDWMGFYRFLAPTIPLKNIVLFALVFRLTDATNQWFTRLATVIANSDVMKAIARPGLAIVIVTQQLATGVTYAWIPAGNCSKRLSEMNRFTSIEEMNLAVMELNCAYRRDITDLQPFIDGELNRYLAKYGRIVVISYQAGYFPSMLRQRYTTEQVYFIDSMGLSDKALAILPGEKNFLGNADGYRIDRVLRGEAGQLSTAVLAHHPNMVYMLQASRLERDNLVELGFDVVWDRPGAVIFFSKGNIWRSGTQAPE